MNIKILLFIVAAGALSSCSTAFKSGQTPDDVYFSPARVIEEDNTTDDRDEAKEETCKDRQIQMSVYDRRWRDFDDDYDYRYDPYHYGYNYGYYYNPYYCYYPVYISNVVISNPKNSVPRMTNLGSYHPSTYVIHNTKTGISGNTYSTKPYNNSNNINTYIRKILNTTIPAGNSNNTNNSTRSSENNTRSYTPSSGSIPGSSSSGSGTPVTRPSR